MADKKPRGWSYLEELLSSEAFIYAVEKVRLIDEFTQIPAIVQLMQDFGIPANYHAVVSVYVKTGEIDQRLLHPSVTVVSDRDRTVEPAPDPSGYWHARQIMPQGGVSLQLAHDVTQPELIAFIKNHWDDLIKPRLEAIAGKRPPLRYAYFPERDREIYEIYKNRKALGLTIDGVLFRFNISRSQLYRIKKRQEKFQ